MKRPPIEEVPDWWIDLESETDVSQSIGKGAPLWLLLPMIHSTK